MLTAVLPKPTGPLGQGLPNPSGVGLTVLRELRGAEKGCYPERLLRGPRGLIAISQEDALGKGELEVAGRILKVSVFFTLFKIEIKTGEGEETS